MAEEKNYGAESIQVLEGLEAVRKRPAMYIGSTSTQGLHHLVYEVVDNSINEVMARFAQQVSVIVHNDGSVTVEDDGRGIPVDIHPEEGRSAAEVIMTVLHAGGKFDKKAYQVSGGLHGVGVSVVNALSESMTVESVRDGKVWTQSYERGIPTNKVKSIGKANGRRGTTTTFRPDPEMFETVDVSFEVIAQRLRESAYLTKGVHIRLVDERVKPTREKSFYFEGGLVSFVRHLNSRQKVFAGLRSAQLGCCCFSG